MNHSPSNLVMFDIDGTLVESYDFDTQCFKQAAQEVLGVSIDTEWHTYPHVTDSGITRELLKRHNVASDKHETVVAALKSRFLNLTETYIAEHGVRPIPGAAAFLTHLQKTKGVTLALATGGWAETARMKLNAAGLPTSRIPLASASDHHDRVEIMKIAERKAGGTCYQNCTYFGDGVWDRTAASHLGYGFVLVGDRLQHNPSVPDYQNLKSVLQCLPC